MIILNVSNNQNKKKDEIPVLKNKVKICEKRNLKTDCESNLLRH